MPDDVKAALDRFEKFLAQFPGGSVIDDKTGFTSNDGFLIYSELQMLEEHHSEPDEDPID